MTKLLKSGLPLMLLVLLSISAAILGNSRVQAQSTVPPGKIAFASDRDGDFEIYAMDADGSNQTRLTTNTAEDFWPVWSPDGTKIAFYSNRDGNNEIYVMQHGSGQTRLTINDADDREPTWSPDGTKIAFISRRDAGNDEIYVMDGDGSAQTRLTESDASEQHPAWSPDGTKLGTL